MNRLPDRAARRRYYLIDKSAVQSQRMLGLIILIGSGIATFAVLCAIVNFITRDAKGSAQYEADTPNVRYVPPTAGEWLLDLCGLAITGCGVAGGMRVIQSANRRNRSIAYVPPVSRQLPYLPAEEILLRGSGSPVSHDELLRPVINQPSQAEELLRATQIDP